MWCHSVSKHGIMTQVTLQPLHRCLAMFLFAYIAGAVYPSPYQETRLGVSTTILSLVHIPMFPTLIHVILTMKCSTASHFLSRGQGCSNPSWINYSNLLWGKNVSILHLLNLTPKRMGGGLGASLEEEGEIPGAKAQVILTGQWVRCSYWPCVAGRFARASLGSRSFLAGVTCFFGSRLQGYTLW